MADNQIIDAAKEHFGQVVAQQLERVERLKNEPDWVDYSSISPIVVGMLGGDGIGPSISAETQTVLEHLLRGEVDSGKLEFRVIDGLTIENRAEQMQSIPDDVLAEIKDCHVTLKGPTHTPEQGDGWPNLESANVAMRKELDLFANIRPVRIPAEGIDWTFFRENTEDMYAVGNQGINVTEDLGIDFRVITSQGSRRIIDAAFAHAQRTGRERVTIVTKANIIKTTDGKFLDIAREVSQNYPGIEWDGWYIDIMTAALINPARQKDFQVPALPNLRRHSDGRGGADTGWRRDRRKRERRQAARDVRGDPRQRSQDGAGEPSAVRRPKLAAPRRSHDAGAHRLHGHRREAAQSHRHLRPVRAKARHDRPRHRRDQRRVRRVPHGHRRGSEDRRSLAKVRRGDRVDIAPSKV